jgi:hypothetical protein
MLVHVAVGLNRPEVAVEPGQDVPDDVLALVAEAAPELRARCREYIMGHTLAPHAKWAEPPAEDETVPEPVPEVTVADLEALLSGLAEDGDRAAVLALLAAKDPTRYGPPGRQSAPPESVDGVDFVPAITTPAK